MGFDLRHGIEELLAQEPRPGEHVDPRGVMARVRRHRIVRGAAAGSVAAAAVVGTALVVQAAPWQSAPAPPAEPTPSVTERETAPAPEPTSEAPDPTTPPEAEQTPPLVGLTAAGEIAMLDPSTGETLEVVTQGAGLAAYPLSVDEARDTVYATRLPDPSGTLDGAEVVAVSLTDGGVSVVAPGTDPSLSPDGSTLAYFGPLEGETAMVAYKERALVLLDLETGVRQYVPDGTGQDFMRGLEGIAWAPDGSYLLVGTGWAGEMGPGSSSIAVVDVTSSPATLVDAPTLDVDLGDAPPSMLEQAFFLTHGSLVAVEYVPGDDTRATSRNLVVVEEDAVEVRAPLPIEVAPGASAAVFVTQVTQAPDGEAIAVSLLRYDWGAQESTYSVWQWDGAQGFTQLSDGVAAAAW